MQCPLVHVNLCIPSRYIYPSCMQRLWIIDFKCVTFHTHILYYTLLGIVHSLLSVYLCSCPVHFMDLPGGIEMQCTVLEYRLFCCLCGCGSSQLSVFLCLLFVVFTTWLFLRPGRTFSELYHRKLKTLACSFRYLTL